MHICTVLPTYNERGNIAELITRLMQAMTQAAPDVTYRILVVDDDSPDGTWEVVAQLQTTFNSPDQERLTLIHRVGESGLTSAIQRGIDAAIAAGAEVVTWMDCDLSMPPEDLPRLARAIQEQGADVAIGSRWLPGGGDVAHGFMARTLSWLINHFAMLLLGSQITDYTSGFIAARSAVLQRFPLVGNYGEYCIDLLARAAAAGYRVVELPYLCVPRTRGASKTGANLWDYLQKGQHYVATIWRLRGLR